MVNSELNSKGRIRIRNRRPERTNVRNRGLVRQTSGSDLTFFLTESRIVEIEGYADRLDPVINIADIEKMLEERGVRQESSETSKAARPVRRYGSLPKGLCSKIRTAADIRRGFLLRFEKLEEFYRDIGLAYFEAVGYAVPDAGMPVRVLAGGIGSTDERAASATLGEAVERYSTAVWSICELTSGTAAGLGADVIQPLQLFAWREKAAQIHRSQYEAVPVAWTQASGIVCGERRLLPAQFVYNGFADAMGEPCFAPWTSSGTAVATTECEAAFRALLEIIERHTLLALWHFSAKSVDVPRTAAAEIAPELAKLEAEFFGKLRFLAVENEVGVPMAICVAQGLDAHARLIGQARLQRRPSNAASPSFY
jgi:YcaO cyclodehydratase, ATP-ad Mg2+-binding